jgi:hypothetical protein
MKEEITKKTLIDCLIVYDTSVVLDELIKLSNKELRKVKKLNDPELTLRVEKEIKKLEETLAFFEGN